ncbi:kinase-like protein [Epithele typhae]|uniref:kinase-like protein n=1 Tax=Epithele typhae TaxID=378194 RepID=UPI0020077C35|nr:kinase-like protein [Epithele typhae]KAH9939011.1 kinase-like protein [Epithele typhae]
MVVKKKERRRRPLSAIVEASEGYSNIRTSMKLKRKTVPTVNATHFEYIRSLDPGPSGEEVILARKIGKSEGGVYAVKLSRKSGCSGVDGCARMVREQAALKLLAESRAKFVLRLWWSFEDERAMYVVVDPMGDRNLQDAVLREGPLARSQALLCAAELVAGISAIHEAGIVHTLVKPEHILIGEDGHILISGFDNATCIRRGNTLLRGGGHSTIPPADEIQYQAPEIVLGWQYNSAVDWWSFGLLVHWLLSGEHPFVNETVATSPAIVRSYIIHGSVTSSARRTDPTAWNLISQCLNRNPSMRIDGTGVKMHEYFHDILWEDVVAKQLEAPFFPADRAELSFSSEDDTKPIPQPPALRTRLADTTPTFAFDWQLDLPSVNSTISASNSHFSTRPSPLASQPDTQMLSKSPLVISPGSSLANIIAMAKYPSRPPSELAPPSLDGQTRATTPTLDTLKNVLNGLPTPPNSRFALRKYASLDFDELDAVASLRQSSLHTVNENSSGILRKSRSILTLSRDSLRLRDDSSSTSSSHWTNKFRRRSRVDSIPSPSPPIHQVIPPVPPVPPIPPVPRELPKGLEQIGGGIGYTRRPDERRLSMNLASLTPRTCHAIFRSKPGVRPKQKDKGKSRSKSKDKDKDVSSSDKDVPAPRGAGQLSGNELEDEEDLMDEVMREIYGDGWDGSAGSARAGGGAGVGLGWGTLMTPTRFETAEDASFGGPDCTLRLVTSPSTPWIDS